MRKRCPLPLVTLGLWAVIALVLLRPAKPSLPSLPRFEAARLTAWFANGGATPLPPDKLPLTPEEIRQAGYARLSPRQQAWLRQRYARDLTRLQQTVGARRAAAWMLGEGTVAGDCTYVLGLLHAARRRLKDDAYDPTLEQPLLDQVQATLRRGPLPASDPQVQVFQILGLGDPTPLPPWARPEPTGSNPSAGGKP